MELVVEVVPCALLVASLARGALRVARPRSASTECTAALRRARRGAVTRASPGSYMYMYMPQHGIVCRIQFQYTPDPPLREPGIKRSTLPGAARRAKRWAVTAFSLFKCPPIRLLEAKR